MSSPKMYLGTLQLSLLSQSSKFISRWSPRQFQQSTRSHAEADFLAAGEARSLISSHELRRHGEVMSTLWRTPQTLLLSTTATVAMIQNGSGSNGVDQRVNPRSRRQEWKKFPWWMSARLWKAVLALRLASPAFLKYYRGIRTRTQARIRDVRSWTELSLLRGINLCKATGGAKNRWGAKRIQFCIHSIQSGWQLVLLHAPVLLSDSISSCKDLVRGLWGDISLRRILVGEHENFLLCMTMVMHVRLEGHMYKYIAY